MAGNATARNRDTLIPYTSEMKCKTCNENRLSQWLAVRICRKNAGDDSAPIGDFSVSRVVSSLWSCWCVFFP